MRSEHPELARPPKRCFLLFGHPCRLFLGPGFWLVARWNRLGEAVKTRKNRETNGEEMGEIRSKRCEGVGITWGLRRSDWHPPADESAAVALRGAVKECAAFACLQRSFKGAQQA